MNAEELSEELEICRRLAGSCRGECKSKPVVNYWVGCTTIECECIKVALPDWMPRECVRIWNKAWLNDRITFTQGFLDKHVETFLHELVK